MSFSLVLRALSTCGYLRENVTCRWIPDGQLCPTVPNRSNYIHWIEDLLSSDIITNTHAKGDGEVVRGFDIGTGANCIYPLLGATLLGWRFVGSGSFTGTFILISEVIFSRNDSQMVHVK